jgi:hypothetical protein
MRGRTQTYSTRATIKNKGRRGKESRWKKRAEGERSMGKGRVERRRRRRAKGRADEEPENETEAEGDEEKGKKREGRIWMEEGKHDNCRRRARGLHSPEQHVDESNPTRKKTKNQKKTRSKQESVE